MGFCKAARRRVVGIKRFWCKKASRENSSVRVKSHSKCCSWTIKVILECRDRPANALKAGGCPLATLKITLDVTKFKLSGATPEWQESSESAAGGHSREASTYSSSVQEISAASDAVKGRTVAFAGAVRLGVARKYLLSLVESDSQQGSANTQKDSAQLLFRLCKAQQSR